MKIDSWQATEIRRTLRGWQDGNQVPTEEQVNEARRVLERDYWNDVRSIVAGIAADVIDGEGKTEEQIADMVHEACDGHERVIYTWRSLATLLVCSNHDAGPEEMDVSCFVDDPAAIDWAALTYWAIRKDVWDLVHSLDLCGLWGDVEESEEVAT